MDTFFRTVDVMASCPNTLGILVADMLINNDASVACIPVIAAVVRDLKKYMALKNEETGQRILPIGYSAATIEARDMAILDYLSSGDKGDSIDFWTVSTCVLGNHVWCQKETDSIAVPRLFMGRAVEHGKQRLG